MSNRQKKKANRKQIILFVIFIPVIIYSLYYYYQQKEIAELAVVNFKSPSSKISQTFYLEIADEPSEQKMGLMYRKQMDEDKGMLFKFKNEKIQSFWMKNTYIPLDIIFLNSNYKVVGVINNTPILSEKSLKINTPSKYVVELNAGLADKHKISQGSSLIIKN